MKCPKCGFLSFDYLERCKQCGADWASVREQLATKTRARATKGPESSPLQAPELTHKQEALHPSEFKLRIDEEFDRLYAGLKSEEQKIGEIRWGGFFRRGLAFFIDVEVLSLLSLLLFYLVYVGYSVGLVAHNQMVTADHVMFFLRVYILSWIFLVSGYFVLLHGMDGRTIGKWVLGLRVVGANKARVSYRQALIRWLGYVGSALFALGFLWILLSREKRGWHDIIARTWVVRDWARTTSLGN